MDNKNLVPMGKILGAHGRTGTVKVISYAESLEILNQQSEIFIKTSRGAIKKQSIRWIKPHHRHLLVSFEGINTRSAAGDLKSSEICIHRQKLPELPDDTYYWFDLIGITVNNGEGDPMGVIERIIDNGAHDVYVVKNGKKETLIPAVATVIKTVDLKKRCMQVNYAEPV